MGIFFCSDKKYELLFGPRLPYKYFLVESLDFPFAIAILIQ
jgi:hypothetical protein